jgi:hypothetical protein
MFFRSALLLLLSLSACDAVPPDSEAGGPVDTAAVLPAEVLGPPMALVSGPIQPGRLATLTVTGASTNANVDFYSSENGAAAAGTGGRVAAHGNVRSGLARPLSLLGRARADGAGVATLSYAVPATWTDGETIATQAITGRGARASLSNVVLTVVDDMSCVDDFAEDNDDAARAVELTQEGIPNALDLCPEDEDWFAVQLAAGEPLRVYLDFANANGDIDVAVYDPAGTTQLGVSQGVTDQEEVSIVAGSAGLYLVRVYLYNEGGDPGNAYDLEFHRGDPAILASGLLTTPSHGYVDLDRGRVLQDYDAALGDIRWGVRWANDVEREQFLWAEGGTQLQRMYGGTPSYAQCANLTQPVEYVYDNLQATDALTTVWYCANTADGRVARFFLMGVDDANDPRSMVLQHTTWDEPRAMTAYNYGGFSLSPGQSFDWGVGGTVQGANGDVLLRARVGGWELVPTIGAQIAAATNVPGPEACAGVSLATSPVMLNYYAPDNDAFPSVCVRTRAGHTAGLFVDAGDAITGAITGSFARWE